MTNSVLNRQFFSAHLEEQIQEVFHNSSFTRLESTLEFPGARPVLEYWDSIQDSYDISEAAWTRGHQKFEKILETRFENNGLWRVTKNVAIISALNAQV